MMGKTHKGGGALAALVAFDVLWSKGLLDTHIHPVVQLLVMYPACMWGSIAPDLDQSKEAIPEKTLMSVGINRLLHLGKISHRSWQTHCITLTAIYVSVMFGTVVLLTQHSMIDSISTTILNLMLAGLASGIASHLFLDSFTYEGVHLIPPIKVKGKKKKYMFRLVPKWDMFKTDTLYEKIVRVVLYIATVLMLVYIICKRVGLFNVISV